MRNRVCPRPRAGVDAGVAAVTASSLSFGACALRLPFTLLLVFGLGVSTPRAISAMPVSLVPSEPPSLSLPSPSLAGGQVRLARSLVLALAPICPFGFGNRARMLWQFSRKKETSLFSAFVESARNRARFPSVCCATQK